MFNETISVRGDLVCTVYDDTGIKRKHEFTNLVVTTGKNFIANILALPPALIGGQTLIIGKQYYYNGYIYTCTTAGTTATTGIPTSITQTIGNSTTLNTAVVKCDVNVTTDGITSAYMGIGTGITTPVITDTALQTALGARVVVDRNHIDGTQIASFFSSFPGTTYASTIIREAGLFTALTSGKMICRTSFGAITLLSTEWLGIEWKITIL